MYFSALINGFYDSAIHGENIPADAICITTEQYAQLMQSQSNGSQIIADERGYPIAIDPPHVRTMTSLLSDVAAKRWQVETSGILVAGHPMATDRESQAQLNSAYTSLKSGLITDTPWKAVDGCFTLVTLAELEPVVLAVAAHVRACFAAEQAHSEAINALQTQAEMDAYDINAGWSSVS